MGTSVFQQAVDEYLTYLDLERGCSPNTVKHYGTDLRIFVGFLDGVSPSVTAPAQIERQHVRAFLAHLRSVRNNSSRTCVRRLAAVSAFYRFMLETGGYDVAANPCEGIRRPRYVARLPQILTREEAERLLDAACSHGAQPLRDEAMFRLFLQTGCRLAELLRLRVADVQLDANRIRLLGKGNKERWVPLTAKTCAALRRYLASPERVALPGVQDALLHNRQGRPLTGAEVYRVFKRVVTAAGLEGRGLSPHKLRHTCLTLLLESGADLRTLQEIAGHSSIEVTQIYTHVSSQRVQAAMDRHPLA